MSATNIIRHLFKAAASLFIIGFSFYVSFLFLGPFLCIPVGMFFVLIFGDGAYLEYLGYLISFLCGLGLSIKLIAVVYDSEIEAFKAKKQRQKNIEMKKSLRPVLEEMKQNTRDDDKEGQKAIKDMTGFVYGTKQQRKEIASLQSVINKLKKETSPDDKQARKNIKFLEKLLKEKIEEKDTM